MSCLKLLTTRVILPCLVLDLTSGCSYMFIINTLEVQFGVVFFLLKHLITLSLFYNQYIGPILWMTHISEVEGVLSQNTTLRVREKVLLSSVIL